MEKTISLSEPSTSVVAANSTPPAHLKYFGYFSNASADGMNIDYQSETNPHTTMIHLGTELFWNIPQLRNELAQAKADGIKVILCVDGFILVGGRINGRFAYLPNPEAQANWDALAHELYVNGYIDIEFPENGTVVAFYPCDEPDLNQLNDIRGAANPTLKNAIDIMRGNPLTARIPIATIVAKNYQTILQGIQLFDWVGHDLYEGEAAYLASFDQFKIRAGLRADQRTMLVPLATTLTWAQSVHSAESMYNKALTDPSIIAIIPYIWRNPGADTINSLREPPLSWLRQQYETVGLRIKNGPAGYNSEFVTQNIPTTMRAGQLYQVQIQYKNKGKTWQPNAVLLGTQNPRDNMIWGTSRANIYTTVGFDQTANIVFDVLAPNAPGIYDMRFQMLAENVTWFGPMTPNLKITVTA